MPTITDDYISTLYEPKFTKKAKEKLKRFEKLKVNNGFSVAYGMLLKAVSKDYVSLEEISNTYRDYLVKFSSKYYIIPAFGPNMDLERKLEIYVEYDFVEQKKIDKTFKYKITKSGEGLIEVYLPDKELKRLFK